MLVLIVACVLAVALWPAGQASASSRRWTIANHSYSSLTLVSVKPWEDNEVLFEPFPRIGTVIPAAFERPWSKEGSIKEEHVELAYGGNVQAVLKYRIDHLNGRDYVEYRIKNALDFSDARCRFLEGDHQGEWGWRATVYNHAGTRLFECVAGAKLFSRTVAFGDDFHPLP